MVEQAGLVQQRDALFKSKMSSCKVRSSCFGCPVYTTCETEELSHELRACGEV